MKIKVVLDKKKITQHNRLLYLWQTLGLKAINEGKLVGCAMIDFRKAFDLIDHKLLLKNYVFISSVQYEFVLAQILPK